jgi:hypothetical protein
MTYTVEKIPGYELAAPTRSTMFDVLARYVECDEAQAVWTTLCERVGLDPKAHLVDPQDAMKIVDALEDEGGVFASCAKGLRIRIMTFIILGQRSAHVE